MGTMTAKCEHRIGQLGHSSYGLHAMYSGDGRTAVAMRFGSEWATGISVEFHASGDEVREFARKLVEYADAADKAHADAQVAA